MVSLVWNEEDAKASYIKQGEERGEERGEKRGEERGVLRSLKSVMARLHESAENAMDILNIPAEQRPRYRQLLESGE
ncbi:MAG: hypothetical protein IJS96_10785 [Schwartzia sp.]|nr:hypothetical protein [Schwartzia sp. (in: firmicutes)]